MNDLFLRSEGIKGSGCKTKLQGFVEAEYDGNYICVDNFEGRGDTYKKREQARIYIVINGKRYAYTFKSLQFQLNKK